MPLAYSALYYYGPKYFFSIACCRPYKLVMRHYNCPKYREGINNTHDGDKYYHWAVCDYFYFKKIISIHFKDAERVAKEHVHVRAEKRTGDDRIYNMSYVYIDMKEFYKKYLMDEIIFMLNFARNHVSRAYKPLYPLKS